MLIFVILVHLWFIIVSLVFSYLSKRLFSGLLQFKCNCVRGQNNSQHRDWAVAWKSLNWLTPGFTLSVTQRKAYGSVAWQRDGQSCTRTDLVNHNTPVALYQAERILLRHCHHLVLLDLLCTALGWDQTATDWQLLHLIRQSGYNSPDSLIFSRTNQHQAVWSLKTMHSV